MHPWLKYVRDILNSCGLSYVWINQSFSSINWLKSIVKDTLVNQFLQDWFRNVENSPKSGQEIYLKKLPNDLRVLFTKFRTCNHKLPIETGRWSNIERFHRICLLHVCNKTTLGDEYHYVMKCQAFSIFRNKLIEEKYSSNVNTYFGNLMNTIGIDSLKTLSIFVKKILA